MSLRRLGRLRVNLKDAFGLGDSLVLVAGLVQVPALGPGGARGLRGEAVLDFGQRAERFLELAPALVALLDGPQSAGRLVDLLERKAIDLSFIRTLVLDEADEMLSMGFKKELDTILKFTAGKRYTWLFSATMPQEIKAIISSYMSPQAMRVEVNKNEIVNRDIEHKFLICTREEKPDVLFQFLKTQGTGRGLVFCRTKVEAQTVTKRLLAKKINADALHGDMMQKERDKVMRAFKNGKLQILIATDLAARGIDVKELAFVVHYQLPEKSDYYTHRSGRTGRAGNKGFSLSMITTRELPAFKGIEKELGLTVKEIHR